MHTFTNEEERSVRYLIGKMFVEWGINDNALSLKKLWERIYTATEGEIQPVTLSNPPRLLVEYTGFYDGDLYIGNLTFEEGKILNPTFSVYSTDWWVDDITLKEV